MTFLLFWHVLMDDKSCREVIQEKGHSELLIKRLVQLLLQTIEIMVLPHPHPEVSFPIPIQKWTQLKIIIVGTGLMNLICLVPTLLFVPKLIVRFVFNPLEFGSLVQI